MLELVLAGRAHRLNDQPGAEPLVGAHRARYEHHLAGPAALQGGGDRSLVEHDGGDAARPVGEPQPHELPTFPATSRLGLADEQRRLHATTDR